jgi:hypothetical protein
MSYSGARQHQGVSQLAPGLVQKGRQRLQHKDFGHGHRGEGVSFYSVLILYYIYSFCLPLYCYCHIYVYTQSGRYDVVLFHAPTHKTMISAKTKKQFGSALLALLSMEQPNYATVLKDLQYLRLMDLLVTYSLSSEFPGTRVPNMPITYYPTHILSAQHVLQSPLKSFNQKDGYGTGVSVALFTSNCQLAGAKERYEYLKELISYVPVHSYGKCFHNREEPAHLADSPLWPAIAQRRARKISILSNYKFYLAFENSPIDDYVSEKVFEGVFAGTLSVYRGASGIHQFMPSNDSFINANNLTPRALADLILRVGADEQEYSKYFAFQQRPLSAEFQQIADMSYVHPNVVKRLCDRAFATAETRVQRTEKMRR